jgi:hypothetical protein
MTNDVRILVPEKQHELGKDCPGDDADRSRLAAPRLTAGGVNFGKP